MAEQQVKSYLNLSNEDYSIVIQKANSEKQFFPQSSECPSKNQLRWSKVFLSFCSSMSSHHHAFCFSCFLKGRNCIAFGFSLSSVHIAFFCAHVWCVLCINWHGSCDFK